MQHNEGSGVLEAFAQYTQAFQVLECAADGVKQPVELRDPRHVSGHTEDAFSYASAASLSLA
jgi:hypothetical protein